MEIKKGQVWECVHSYENWRKGHRYECKKDGYLHNGEGENEQMNDYKFLNNYFKLVEEEQSNDTPRYYNNEKGSIYQFCDEKGLNSYEFDIIKRVVRCRKKGLFVEDLQKTKNLIDLYLKEFNHEK